MTQQHSPHCRHPTPRTDHSRAHPHRQLLLAAREEQPRSDRLPGSGKCLHPGEHGPHGRFARNCLPGNGRAHPGNRQQRPGGPRWLLLLHAHRGGPAVRHPLPQKGQPGRAGRNFAGRKRSGRRNQLLQSGRFCHQPGPYAAGLLHRHQRRRTVHHLHQKFGHGRAAARPDFRHLLLGGMGQRQPHPALHDPRRRLARLQAVPPRAGQRPGR